ncbi:MAG TPA: hypothetical protein VM367_13855 [Pseudonocardia sp.]|jgi:hypothetical protein|nr:hypothetical protein [Pseudonocardia sp.]
MRLYAELPGRLARQVLGDALALAWLVATGFVAVTAYDLILALQAPARALVSAGESVRDAFDDAARIAGGVPLVGDDLAGALAGGSGAGGSLVESGREQAETVATVALGTGIGIALLGLAPVLLFWVPLRLRYARAAGSAVAVRDGHPDLLALRALAGRPVRQLLAVSPDPAGAWRAADDDALRGLAALELRALGLRSPAVPSPGRGVGVSR